MDLSLSVYNLDPQDLLASLEEELCFNFSLDPQTVLLSLESNSFSRLLVHGLCQYMELESTSESSIIHTHTHTLTHTHAYTHTHTHTHTLTHTPHTHTAVVSEGANIVVVASRRNSFTLPQPLLSNYLKTR